MRFRVLQLWLFFVAGMLSLMPAQSQTQAPERLTDIANSSVDNEQETFTGFISFHAMDSRIRKHLRDFSTGKVDSIQEAISNAEGVSEDLKSRCIRSLTFFLRGLKETLKNNKLNAYEVPDLVDRYMEIQAALIRNEPFLAHLADMGPVRSQLIANALWQFNFSNHMDQLATFKRVASSPENILSFLEATPTFYYRDSLVLVLARTQPMRLAAYLQRNETPLSETIRTHPDPTVQQIIGLLPERNMSEIVPFCDQLVAQTLTTEQILQTRKDVHAYFRLLVNTLMSNSANLQRPETESFQPALRQALHDKALSFYIKPINEQHAENDAVRFASVRTLRPEDLYYVIVTGQDDLYTSSYLGLYRRLIDCYKQQDADQLLKTVHYDQFRTFLRMAANYNTLTDFLGHMSAGAREEVIRLFISGVDQDIEDGLQEAMDIADSFIPLSQNDTFNVLVQRDIAANLEQSFEQQSFYGVRIYSILQQVFNAIDKKEAAIKMFSRLGDYESLPLSALSDDSGHIVQVMLFYGDTDGAVSFRSFSNLFRDTTRWKVDTNSRWIAIRSRPESRLVIYANRPLDNETGLDLAAQDSLWQYFTDHGIQPTMLIHRGHSYHLRYSLRRLEPGVKLALLGSCGSYNNILGVANLSPDAQIIASRQVGSMTVNDPLLNLINQRITGNEDLVWNDIWRDMGTQLKDKSKALQLFQEYVPPNKNIGLFVLKLYNYGEPE